MDLVRSISSSFQSSPHAPQETPASADIERQTGAANPTLQVLKKDLVLCSEEEFHSYFRQFGLQPSDKFLVLSAIGGYAAGKSTLLNHLFFKGENVFDTVEREGISGLTIGMNVALVRFTYFGQKQETVYLLVVDSEGVSSPTENSLDCAFLLSLRLLLISDAMIHNSTSSLQRSEFMPLNEASGRLFQNKKNKPDVNLIFFVQRANLFYQRSQDLHQFFPQRTLPKWFPNFEVSTSKDKIQSDQDGIRLELEDLKRKLVVALERAPKMTVKSLWGQLKHLDENLPTPKPNETIEESFTGCRMECSYCKSRCTRDRFWKHDHENYTHECPGSKKVTHKCKQCVLAEEPIHSANAEWTIITPQLYNGALWYCNNPKASHGELAHRFSWNWMPPFLHESKDFKNNVLKHREHQFGPLDLAMHKEPLSNKVVAYLPLGLGGVFILFCSIKMFTSF